MCNDRPVYVTVLIMGIAKTVYLIAYMCKAYRYEENRVDPCILFTQFCIPFHGSFGIWFMWIPRKRLLKNFPISLLNKRRNIAHFLTPKG